MDKMEQLRRVLHEAAPSSQRERGVVFHGPVTINVYGGEPVFATGAGDASGAGGLRALADTPPARSRQRQQ